MLSVKNSQCNLFDLSSARLDGDDMLLLVTLLNEPKHKQIKKLELAENNIRAKGVSELIRLNFIEEIDLSKTDIGTEGAITLLREGKFKIVNLSQIGLTDGERIKIAVAGNVFLKKVILYCTQLSEKLKQEIKTILNERTQEVKVSSVSGTMFHQGGSTPVEAQNGSSKHNGNGNHYKSKTLKLI